MFRLGSHKRASDYNKAFEEICNNVRAKCKMPEDFLEAFEAREGIDYIDPRYATTRHIA